MTDGVLIALTNLGSLILGGGAITAWFKLGPERRKQHADTQSQILKDLREAYERVCDELAQVQMKLVLCQTENEHCRQRVQKMEGLYQVSMLSRARAHLAIKTLGSYELHIDYLLDQMRHHSISISPMMRTTKLRAAYHLQQEKLDAMETEELENLTKAIDNPPIQ